jgi:serine phosphatase RsbU (regulator of sigma subunit)
MVFEASSPERAAILLLQDEPRELTVQAERGAGERIQVSRTISDLVIRGKQAIITQDAQVDERLAGSDSVMMRGIRAALCAPLWNNREVIGLVYLDSVAGRGSFSRDDLQVVTLLANLAAVKIENERLFLRDQAMQEMERELSAAARIQQRLLPLHPPTVAGYELVGMNIPCRAVGGDTFDFQMRGSGRLGIALGDVAGKGMGAALIMAMFQAVFRAHASTDISLLDLIARLNRSVCDNAEPGKFITLFCADLDVESHRLHFVNAGHNPPLLMAPDGRVQRLHTGGIILGFSPDVSYQEDQVELPPGAVLLLYSDGITEARNQAGEEYGEARLLGVLSACHQLSVTAIRDRVMASVHRFSGGGEQEDDITLSILKRLSP